MLASLFDGPARRWSPSRACRTRMLVSVAMIDRAFVVGFTARLLALYRGWEGPLASEPSGVYTHGDGRPLIGRKLAGYESPRELRDLGLLVENGDSDDDSRCAPPAEPQPHKTAGPTAPALGTPKSI